MGRRRTRLPQDERRAQILDAARRVYSASPAETVSVEAVAREAGVTPGLVHHYFGSKHELYVALVREMSRRPPPVPARVPGSTREQRLAASTDHWLDMVASNRETWLAALGAEGLGADPEVEGIFERVRESAVDSIVTVLGLGPAATAPAELRAVLRAFGGLAEAATREWLQHARLDRAQTHALLTETLLALVDDVLPSVRAAAGDAVA